MVPPNLALDLARTVRNAGTLGQLIVELPRFFAASLLILQSGYLPQFLPTSRLVEMSECEAMKNPTDHGNRSKKLSAFAGDLRRFAPDRCKIKSEAAKNRGNAEMNCPDVPQFCLAPPRSRARL